MFRKRKLNSGPTPGKADKKKKYKSSEIVYDDGDETELLRNEGEEEIDEGTEEVTVGDDNNSSEGGEEEDEEVQRTSIRKELSTLTFEELEALKAKLGTKVYNEAMFGTKSAGSKLTKIANKVFKRDNPNRPRELSSKTRVPKVREIIHIKKKIKHMDPRFEEGYGELNESLWKNNYSFLTDLEKQEQDTLREKLKTDEIEEEKKPEIREYLQKAKNKERSDAQKKKIEETRKVEKEENKKREKEGKRPYFMKKSTRKYVELAEKYDELKASGKLESYLNKKRKRNAVRDKKSMKF